MPQNSKDCNGNGIPDECDIASGDSNDCNGNGIPDECDIANGDSVDDNGDGVPDECQLDARVAPVVTLIDPNLTTDVRTALPESEVAVVRGSTYYIEVWASDVGNTNPSREDKIFSQLQAPRKTKNLNKRLKTPIFSAEYIHPQKFLVFFQNLLVKMWCIVHNVLRVLVQLFR